MYSNSLLFFKIVHHRLTHVLSSLLKQILQTPPCQPLIRQVMQPNPQSKPRETRKVTCSQLFNYYIGVGEMDIVLIKPKLFSHTESAFDCRAQTQKEPSDVPPMCHQLKSIQVVKMALQGAVHCCNAPNSLSAACAVLCNSQANAKKCCKVNNNLKIRRLNHSILQS